MAALQDQVPLRHLRARIGQYLRGIALPAGSVAARIIEERLPDDAARDPVRPSLVLWACAAANGDLADALPVAAAFELFDRFLVLHDELSDESAETIAQWGLGQSLNAGDAFYALAFRALATDVCDPKRRLETARLVGQAVLEAIEGCDAALTRAALVAGAIIAGSPEQALRSFAEAGRLLPTQPQRAGDVLRDFVSHGHLIEFEEVIRYVARRAA